MFTDIFTLALLIHVVNSKMEPKVVKGEPVDISRFSHSASIKMSYRGGSYVCGSSILNQKILLTAAHCVVPCQDNHCIHAVAYTGHAHKRKGVRTKLAGYMIHENYNRQSGTNDIGLVLLKKSLKLGKLMRKVAILKRPPSTMYAVVAGWGLINEEQRTKTNYLHFTELKLWTFEECRRIISTIPNGCLCAGDLDGKSFASDGDSGSALVVKKYIQIGLVSYKRVDISRSVVAFTNVSYFYDWIKLASERMYCAYSY